MVEIQRIISINNKVFIIVTNNELNNSTVNEYLQIAVPPPSPSLDLANESLVVARKQEKTMKNLSFSHIELGDMKGSWP